VFSRVMRHRIPKLLEIVPRVLPDNRGVFVKTFHERSLLDEGVRFTLAEQYFTISHRDVVRGMHFQVPPHAHSKLVYCLSGAVLDVVVDLRVGSPTYGEYACFELSAGQCRVLYIPIGLAHGFRALTDDAVMVYNVSTTYNRESDMGVRWDSIGFDWRIDNPIMSDRDRSFPPLQKFNSPFVYGD
jgi:dTDP-4-dehydrorhamnose 3,5-epimerase